ncbi:hypothetical protein Flavo103_43800 [Flavobacterium collinsii]|uniref:OsmC family protein n=1 Tax=Flavobacterium collinsii TaxID=1114861 RepID=UPI0022C52B91|nr:OsmC family protein [Flavobacterium collinsii]GIQ61245.1 hypothetical protein Flavo103_43800 [Flavobacterium collinsii]
MPKTIKTNYLGKYYSATEAPLNEKPITVNANTYTPVDLLVTAYGSCLLGTIDSAARKNHFEIGDTKSEITFSMSEDKTRVEQMEINILLANNFTDSQKVVIETAAINHCHVGNSLDHNIKRKYEFSYNSKNNL